jgi:hypothetical protein
MSDARHVEKIQNATQGIKYVGWASMNQFLLAFYTSDNPEVLQQSRSSLSYTEGQAFALEKILDAWLKNGPTGNSHDQLQLTITQKTATIMIKETDKAYHWDELCISSSQLDIPYLTTECGLKKMASMYQTTLPCLWLLLSTILAAPNDYEKEQSKEKEGKEEMILRVCIVFYVQFCQLTDLQIIVVIISMLLFMRNQAMDKVQLVISLFLLGARAS